MNILHVVNVSFVLPYYLGEQIDFFQNKGDKIFIACSKSKDLEIFCKLKNVVYIPIPIIRGINPLKDLYSLFFLYLFVRKNDIQVVVGHTPKGGLLSVLVGFISGIQKRIYFRHGLMFETSFGLKRFFLLQIEKFTSFLAHKVVCVSESVLNVSNELNLNNRCKNVLLNKGTCNGIDAINKFNPDLINENVIEQLRFDLGIKDNEFVVGYVGRLVLDKGITELVQAWNLLSKEFFNVKLLLVGPFETRDRLSNSCIQFIQSEKSIVHVDFTKDPSLYYRLMHLFILPSFREGFPTVVLEASSMKLPIITTRSTGCIDSIVEFETGIFCEIDPLSIYEVIRSIILDSTRIESFGINGRKRVLDNFSQEIIWKELFNLYHS